MFQPGHEKKGGRKKGTPNRDKAQVRAIVECCLGKSIPERLMELVGGKNADPEAERDLLLDLMPYCYPKLASVEHSGEIANPEGSDAVKELTAELMKISGMK